MILGKLPIEADMDDVPQNVLCKSAMKPWSNLIVNGHDWIIRVTTAK